MKKHIALLVLIGFTIVGCKSKQAATKQVVNVEDLATKNIIDKHYANTRDFKTMYIKASARYSDPKQNQNVTAEIKIEKDKQILVSVRFLGITMAKALITPSSVSYYEKIKGSFYQGDFTALSKWLGTELNFDKVQNLLIGEALDNLKNGKYKQTDAAPLYRLDDQNETNLKQSYFFDSEQFLLQKEQITQTVENIMIQVVYGNHKKFDQGVFPTTITINTVDPKGKTDISLDYNSVTFNEALSFPYNIPDGYKEVIIK